MGRHGGDRDDVAVVALRLATGADTNLSYKQTFNSCVLVWASRRRRSLILTAAAFAAGEYWHALMPVLLHLLR